jgi:CHAD domain-containing protein
VWLGFLTDMVRQKHLKENRRWAAFIRRRIEHRRRRQATVRRALSGTSFQALSLKLSRLARLEIPRLMKMTPSDNLTQFSQRALDKKLQRALKLAKLRHSDRPEDIHQLRKALRKTRYLGEFFAPVLGSPFDTLTQRLHAAEWVLGKIHDADRGRTLAWRQGTLPSPLLLKRLAQYRYNHWVQVDKKWRRLRQFTSKHATML